jgi:hypothetical protein
MRVPLGFKLFLLLPLSVCAFAMTAVTLSQTTSEAQKGSKGLRGTLRVLQAGEPRKPLNGVAVEPAAEFHLREYTVASAGNAVAIRAAADISDMRGNVSYLWRLRIRSTDSGKVITDRLYDKQIFRSGNGQNEHPTLTENVQLASGQYAVAVILIEVPDGFDLGRLSDKKTEDAQLVLRGTRRLLVR